MKFLFIILPIFLMANFAQANIFTKDYQQSIFDSDDDSLMITAVPIGTTVAFNVDYDKDANADDFTTRSSVIIIGAAKQLEQNKRIQIYLNLGLSYFSTDSDTSWGSSFLIGAGAFYNLDEDLRNSIFFGAGLGINESKSKSVNSTTRNQINLQFGKRFQLSNIGLDEVCFSPSIGWTRSTTSDFTETDLNIIPISFNFFL